MGSGAMVVVVRDRARWGARRRRTLGRAFDLRVTGSPGSSTIERQLRIAAVKRSDRLQAVRGIRSGHTYPTRRTSSCDERPSATFTVRAPDLHCLATLLASPRG